MKLSYRIKGISELKYIAILSRKMKLIADFNVDSIKNKFPIFGEETLNELFNEFDSTYINLCDSINSDEKMHNRDIRYTENHLNKIISDMRELMNSLDSYNFDRDELLKSINIIVNVLIRCRQGQSLIQSIKLI